MKRLPNWLLPSIALLVGLLIVSMVFVSDADTILRFFHDTWRTLRVVFFTQTQWLILFLLLVLFFLFIRISSKSINKIVYVLERLSHGDFTARSNVALSGVIGRLGSVVDRFAKKLQASNVNLQQDIQDRENELKREQVKDEAMLNSIGDGVLATDKEGNVVLFNKVLADMLGWRSEEVIGKKLVDVIKMVDDNGAVIPSAERPLAHTLGEGTMSSFVSYYERRDKSIFPVSITVSPIIFQNEVTGAIAVVRDVTKEKEIDKAKTEFVSLASHQLRTPLSAINWYTETLLSNGRASEFSPQQKQFVERIYESSKRMSELVGSLLNVSRLEMGTFTIQPEVVDLMQLARDVIKEFEPEFSKNKHSFVFSGDDTIPPMRLDKKLTGIIFQNLLSNAIKYTPDGGNIELLIKKEDASVRISVSDTGLGIPEDQKDKIFTKLFRADNAQRMDTQGTGLGLYIVKSIVQKIGGTIGFTSQVGKGTTFHVILPLRTDGIFK